MKKLSLLLAILILAAALYPLPVAAASSGVSEITLTAESYFEESRRVFTNARQIELLLSYLPTEQERLSSFIPATGGIGAEMRFVRGGVEERWFFTGDYVFRNFPGGGTRPYEGNPVAWQVLLAMTGYRKGPSNVAPNGQLSHLGYMFHEEDVKEILLLNGAERLCRHIFGGTEEIQSLLTALEPLTPDSPGKGGQMGAYVFTDKGSYTYYFSKDDTREAAALIRKKVIDKPYWNRYPWTPQWLCQTDPATVASISYTGGGKGDFSPLSLETANPQTIAEIVSFIKEFPVVPGSYSVAKEKLPFEEDSYRFVFHFRSGAQVWVDGRTDTLTVGVTGISHELTYQVKPENQQVLREFFALQAAGIL